MKNKKYLVKCGHCVKFTDRKPTAKNVEVFEFHHSATANGYVSRKVSHEFKKYVGNFGVGFIVAYPRYDSTRYIDIDYYIAVR